MRLLAVLDELADDRDAGGAQQLTELGEVVALGHRADAERALLGTPARLRGYVVRLGHASVAASFHGVPVKAPRVATPARREPAAAASRSARAARRWAARSRPPPDRR